MFRIWLFHEAQLKSAIHYWKEFEVYLAPNRCVLNKSKIACMKHCIAWSSTMLYHYQAKCHWRVKSFPLGFEALFVFCNKLFYMGGYFFDFWSQMLKNWPKSSLKCNWWTRRHSVVYTHFGFLLFTIILKIQSPILTY